ncbi:MAG: hypothetical protein ACK5YR_17380 [Pirellula sp.]
MKSIPWLSKLHEVVMGTNGNPTLLVFALVIIVNSFGCAVHPPVPVTAVPAAPMTLPRYLGLNTAWGGVRNLAYRTRLRASHYIPALEPHPASAMPMALGDPACMASPSPAVAAAAEHQNAEAAAPAKIKAVSYLVSAAPSSDPKIEEAILAALDDASESVRAATLQAILDANDKCCEPECRQSKANGACSTCGSSCGGCCTPAIAQKIYQMGYDFDEKGCPREPSARVRRLARLASHGCPPSNVLASIPIPEELPPAEVISAARQP